eukprot:CAMPEP_0201657712 /NCGR_PEP_ID=MMETSP0494-20130426/860_1 /ASSEMBLY_ACC=CAM_ASM_000839 /TAXON_ID=420259 /ORGANISM="Thalassiosira gravida, Strain GMp14c1" /LENGTH=379 /DNA_ID=CAMNT_0048134599 /DNA_START=98 /DNA_END=1240 /DNA_ORIENTATION=+
MAEDNSVLHRNEEVTQASLNADLVIMGLVLRLREREEEKASEDQEEAEETSGGCNIEVAVPAEDTAKTGEEETQEEQKGQEGQEGQSTAGRWKRSLFRCNPSSFCWSLFCNLYILGDIQTRAHLSIFGGGIENTVQPSYGFWMVGITACMMIFQFTNFILLSIMDAYNVDDDLQINLITFINLTAVVITLLFLLIVISKTRQTIRQRRNIPGSALRDICLSTFCASCVLTQMDSEVSDQIEGTRSDAWRQQELELQRERRREVDIDDSEDMNLRLQFGAKVCKGMVFIFVASLASLVMIRKNTEDQLYSIYMGEIGVELAIGMSATALICWIIWGIKRYVQKFRNRGNQNQFDLEMNKEADQGESDKGRAEQDNEIEIV